MRKAIPAVCAALLGMADRGARPPRPCADPHSRSQRFLREPMEQRNHVLSEEDATRIIHSCIRRRMPIGPSWTWPWTHGG